MINMSIKDRLAKLVDVKTIITIAITAVFGRLALSGAISSDKVWEAFLIIISFYFGTQSTKSTKNNTSYR